MTLAAGTRLGPYEILSPLGAGGMGEVYRARDDRLGREVAVKVLPASFSSDPDRLRRFEQEARAAGVLNHPNITAVYDVGRHGGAPYVVQELLEGETLRSAISRGRLPQKRAVDYSIQLAQGLAAAHEKGIVHRDLKPENVFVTKDGRIKILDFGLAKLVHPERDVDAETSAPTAPPGTEPGVIMGSVGYMSPEQVKGKAVDHRSDVFSLGAVLYEMLSGSPAFRGDSPVETMSAILNEEPTDIAQTFSTPALDRLMRHCLEKVPERRFQSTSDIAFDLETIVSGSASGPSAAPRFGRRTASRALPGALVLALLAVPLGVYLLARSRSAGASAAPTYRQLTFRRGSVTAARFAPDGQTIAFSAAWDGGPRQLYTTRLEFLEPRSIGLQDASLLSVSSQGELATILSGKPEMHLQVFGTLSQVPLSGGAPREILTDARLADWIPGGKGLAVVRRTGNKEQLECPIGHVVYGTPGWIGWPRVSPGGDRVAFFDHELWPDDRGAVAVVDLAGHKRTLSRGWESEEGLAWSADGREVWFSAAKAGTAFDLNAVTLDGRERLVARVPGGVVLHDIFRDGRSLLSRDAVRLSLWCLPPGETSERDLSWLDWSFPADLSPDGKILVFSEQGLESGPHYSACLRKTDGSPVVRLGEGYPLAFSPDGKWVVSNIPTSPNQLVLLPTGPGEALKLVRGGIETYLGASFFPDGKRLLLCGEGAGSSGLYVQEVPGGQPRLIGEGVFSFSQPISPDGKSLAVFDKEHRLVIVPAEGGKGRIVPGVAEGDDLLRWSQDGALFVAHGDVPTRIFRIDTVTGSRTLWKTLAPADPSGVDTLRPIAITPDGKSYAYGCSRALSELFLAEGLK